MDAPYWKRLKNYNVYYSFKTFEVKKMLPYLSEQNWQHKRYTELHISWLLVIFELLTVLE